MSPTDYYALFLIALIAAGYPFHLRACRAELRGES